jgi:hypothetical protein
MKSLLGFLACVAILVPAAASAQNLTLPPDGGNQKASVSQWIGPVEVTVTYHSPDVTGPSGENRRGKIWGGLVPYGMVNLGFGTCGDQCPWRAGANENTVFTVSHDVKIEGQPLRAGAYGLHMIPGKEEWTIIFSTNSTSWGSFFYNPAEDALRVTVKPRPHPYTHWLTYEFTDRQPDRATVALQWEDLEVPWTVTVDDIDGLYVASLRRELRSSAGFNFLGWQRAAQFCLNKKVNLEEAMTWAQTAVDGPFVGQENFATLQTLARLQAANGRQDEAKQTMDRALAHPTATAFQIHALGRQLIADGENDEALRVFTLSHERFKGAWPTNVGMARGLSAVGKYHEALKYAKLALEQAPDPANRSNLEAMIEKLGKGEDVN